MLEGLRILDVTRVLAGPYATMLLADLGAEVIKVEPPEGDDTRRIGPPFIGGESAYFLSVNRGKKSVVLDLKSTAGRAAFDRLAQKSDVLIDNYRPGVADRLGIGAARMATVNPRLVRCSISSFGETGPMSDRPAFDLVIQAWSGAMSVTGEPGRPPVRLGIPLGDLAGGLHAALAISAALVKREQTGVAERIELSLLDCLASMTTYLAQFHFVDGSVPGPQGSSHLATVPYGVFPTKAGWLAVGVFTERFWKGFCVALGKPQWESEFATNADRLKCREILETAIRDVVKTAPVEEWLKRLEAESVPCAPVLSIDRTLALEQMVLRGMIRTYRHATVGEMRTLAGPILRRAVGPPPLLGEHTGEVLKSVAGLSDSEVKALLS